MVNGFVFIVKVIYVRKGKHLLSNVKTISKCLHLEKTGYLNPLNPNI